MAVTKITSKQIAAVPTGQLLSQRDEAQRIIESAPRNSADYKAASANLNVLNGEIGKDLGIGKNATSKLTSTQILSVDRALSNFDTTVNVGTVPTSVQNAINSALTKNINTEEKQINTTLSKSQESEIRSLKDAGADKATINAAIAENKQESTNVRSLLSAPGFQGNDPALSSILYTTTNPDGTAGQQFIRSSDAAYANTTAGQEAQRILDAGYGLLDEFNLPQAYKTGDTTIGFAPYQTGLAALDRNPETGEFQKGQYLSTPIDTSGRSVSHTLTTFNRINEDLVNPAAVSDRAKVIGPAYDERGNITGNIVQDVLQGYKKGDTVGFYLQKPDGSYEYLGGSKAFTPTGGGGFFESTLGKIIVGVGAGLLLGPAAAALGGGTATIGSTIAAGSLLGAASSAITGGDILTGALTGGIGGGLSSYIGSYGGLGSYLARNGIDIGVDTISLLNKVVPGVGGAAAPIVEAGTSVIDDAALASAQSAINAGAAAGLLDDASATALNTNINVFRSGGFTADNAPRTFGGYGLTSADPRIASAVEDAFRNVAFANADEVTQAAINASRAAGQNISLTMPGGEFVLTATPAGVTTQTPFNTFSQTGPVFPSTQAPIEERDINQATPGTGVQNPNIGPGAAAVGLGGAALDALGAATGLGTLGTLAAGAGLIGAINQTPVSTGVGNEKLPAWVYDPAMSGVLRRIQAAQAAMPAPMPNLFGAQFQRGGLGAGQFIGYDLLNRTGDIPAETLLGVSPLAMPPMNLLGVTGGQAPTSQASLV